MRMAIEQLPDDIEALKRLVIEREERIEAQRIEVEAKRVEVIEARLLIEKLKLQIARFKRIQFGRKSERHDERVAQLELIVEELEANLQRANRRADRCPITCHARPKNTPRPVGVRRAGPCLSAWAKTYPNIWSSSPSTSR